MQSTSLATNIGFVSDLEGNLDYWDRFINYTTALSRDTKGKVILNEGYQFVYGGDVCDRGVGDLRILKDLVRLKEDNPDRVHFIIGNRDANKLRIPFSLHPSVLSKEPKAYWTRTPEQQKVADDYKLNDKNSKMKWILKKTMGAPFGFEFRKKELEELYSKNENIYEYYFIDNSPLSNNLNEKRLNEGNKEITDDDVTESFLHILHPKDGILTKYLEFAKISVIIGDCLFIHGAILDYNKGWLPPTVSQKEEIKKISGDLENSSGSFNSSLSEWTEKINELVFNEVQDYKKNSETYLTSLNPSQDPVEKEIKPMWDFTGGYDHSQPGSRLIQYCMGWLADKTLNPSVVYATYLNDGTPVGEPISAPIAEWLGEKQIKRIIVGHQPNGDAPFIMDCDGIQIICTDSSYSKDTKWLESELDLFYENSENNKKIEDVEENWISFNDYLIKKQEITVDTDELSKPNSRSPYTMLEICFNIEDSKTYMRGTLSQKSTYESSYSPNDKNQYIGKKTKSGWYVKTGGVKVNSNSNKNENEQIFYLLSQSSTGHKFKNRLILAENIDKEF